MFTLTDIVVTAIGAGGAGALIGHMVWRWWVSPKRIDPKILENLKNRRVK